MYKNRHLSHRLHRLLEGFPVVVVCGARQVGKTTLLKHEFPEWDLVTFDPAQDIRDAQSDPDLFLRNHPSPLILDEIQYAPNLVAAIKRRVDQNPDRMGQYILTGSQQWHVLRDLSESLAGRAAFLDLEGFTLAEQAGTDGPPIWLESFFADPHGWCEQPHERLHLTRNVLDILWRGSLPRACLMDEDLVPNLWDGYMRTYIERDARMLTEVSDWHQFGKFLRLLSSLSAKEIHYSQLGRDIGVSYQTAKRWLSILVGTYQWYEVPAFSGNLIKRVSSKPKGYIADTGLACRLLQLTSPTALAGHVAYGPLFETWVAAEVRKLLQQGGRGASLYHWRSAGGAEVDLLVERDGKIFPIEIKGSSRAGRGDLSGIHAFMKAYPHLDIPMGMIIAPAEEARRLSDRVVLAPWDLIR